MTATHGTDTYTFIVSSDSAVTLVSTLTGGLTGGNSGFEILAADNSTDVVRPTYAHPGQTEGPWALKAGTYYLKLWTNDYSTGTYRAVVTAAGNPLANDTEPNGALGSSAPITLNTSVTGHLGYTDGYTTDDQDWYRITTSATGTFAIAITKDATLNPYSGTILYKSDGSTTISDMTVAQPAGTYYLVVWANTYTYGAYTLQVGFTPSTQATASLGLSASTVSFGTVSVGGTSSTQQLTLRNNGVASGAVGAISASGDFAVTNDCPATLSAGASCTLNITFAPTAAGSRSGTLTVGGSALTASLSGSGTATTSWAIAEHNHSSAQNVSLLLSFAPASADRNGSYELYVAGLYAGQLYFLSLTPAYQVSIIPYSSGAYPVYTTAQGELLADSSGGVQTYAIPLGDLSSLHGLVIYAGFGRSADDMMNKGQVQQVFVVN